MCEHRVYIFLCVKIGYANTRAYDYGGVNMARNNRNTEFQQRQVKCYNIYGGVYADVPDVV